MQISRKDIATQTGRFLLENRYGVFGKFVSRRQDKWRESVPSRWVQTYRLRGRVVHNRLRRAPRDPSPFKKLYVVCDAKVLAYMRDTRS